MVSLCDVITAKSVHAAQSLLLPVRVGPPKISTPEISLPIYPSLIHSYLAISTPLSARDNQTFLPTMLQVRDIVQRIQREMLRTPTDALDLVASVTRKHGHYVNWETDVLHRLKRSVIWSTAEQRILARQFGGTAINKTTLA